MLIIYRFLINIVFAISPIILIIRLIKKKESYKRFKEKFCLFSQKRGSGKLVWFHGASVGEIQSIIPLIEKIEKNNKVKKILITTNTLSSAKIIEKYNFKKTVHQFFHVDTNFLSKKFLHYWKPAVAFFIDSEIWPNTIINLDKQKIPIVLLNGRITKKTFRRWKNLNNFSKYIFGKINLCLPSSNNSQNYLKKLGIKNIRLIGNLKFSQSESEKIIKYNDINRFISSKKTWCASSTHNDAEIFCGKIHKQLKKKHKNLLTIIIPRHIDRTKSIIKEMQQLKLNTHVHEPKRRISSDTDIYIVNSYGKTKSIYYICKNIFLGGSIIKHGGQNPLEATRYGCNILHGPNIENFKEIYEYLNKIKISSKINSVTQATRRLNKLFSKKNNSKNMLLKLDLIGKEILNKTYKEINIFLK